MKWVPSLTFVKLPIGVKKISYNHSQRLKDEEIYIDIIFIENSPVVLESRTDKQTDKYPFLS